MKFYLRMEGVNLASFVYDTQDLSTVRGGSLLLLEAVEKVRRQVASVTLTPLSTGASSGLFEFDATDADGAESVRVEVGDILKKHPQLKHATFVVDVRLAGTNFVHDRESLLARNRWQQMQQPTIAIPTWNSHVKEPCEEDLIRPGTTVRPSVEKTRVSESVKSRWQFGREQKQMFYAEQTDMTKDREFVYDLDELTNNLGQGNLHHKMAVIYLDGNSFGKLQNDQCTTAEKQRQFDKAVKEHRRDLLTALLKSMGDKKNWISEHGRYRLETLLWGGDEIIWVVPAWHGWKTLSLFYQQSKNWEFSGHKLTYAAGIIFCHHNAPIHRIITLAKELAELAKEKSRKENQFAYLVLESFDHVGRNLRTFLTERYGDPQEVVLSGSGDKMVGVQEAFIRIKRDESLPRRKLHQILQGLQKDPVKAESIEAEIMKDCGDELKTVRQYFGTNLKDWCHMSELWDYMGT